MTLRSPVDAPADGQWLSGWLGVLVVVELHRRRLRCGRNEGRGRPLRRDDPGQREGQDDEPQTAEGEPVSQVD